MAKSSKAALKRLHREFMDVQKSGVAQGVVAGPVSPDDYFEWEAVVLGPQGTPYDGGCFEARISIPQDYPFSPPTMRFTSQMWHPNVFANGVVCISILHSHGDPHYADFESASEQWSPVQSLETVLLSVVSMLAEPNPNSPANVDAAKQWRDNREAFNKKVDQCVRESLGF